MNNVYSIVPLRKCCLYLESNKHLNNYICSFCFESLSKSLWYTFGFQAITTRRLSVFSVLQLVPQFSPECDGSSGVPIELPVKAGLAVLQVSNLCSDIAYLFWQRCYFAKPSSPTTCLLEVTQTRYFCLFPGSELSWQAADFPHCSSDRDGTHTLVLRVLRLKQTKGTQLTKTHTHSWLPVQVEASLMYTYINSLFIFFFQSIFQPSDPAISLAKECVSQGCGVSLFVLSQQDVGGAWPGHIPYLTGGALYTYSHLQVYQQPLTM